MNEHKSAAWPKDIKKTKQRLEIIETLREADKPLSVQEISSVLLRKGNPMWLSTVYRVLETLTQHGMIQKPAVSESGTVLYELGSGHRHYAVCVGCQSVVEIAGCPIETVLPDLRAKNFRVIGHKLQISGFCGECSIKNEARD